MVDWNIILEWAKTNWITLAIGLIWITLAIGLIVWLIAIVVMVISTKLIRRRSKNAKPNISMEIYNRRAELRELDALLSELEEYFKKVESRMVRK